MKPTKFQTKLKNIQMEAFDTASFYFEKPKGFEYYAGQYIRLVLKDSLGEEDSRYFTLSSAPHQSFIRITVRIKLSKYKEALYNLVAGDPVVFYGPIGHLCITGQAGLKYIMLAGGIGVTPFYSMLKELTHQSPFVDALL